MRRTWGSKLLLFLRSVVGRPGPVAADLPLGLAGSVARVRAVELLRGFLRTGAPVFLGANVKIRGKRHITFERWCSVGAQTELDGYGTLGVQLGEASRIGARTVVTVTSHLGIMGKGFRLGARSGLGDFCHVGASGGVILGEDVIAGSYVSFHSQDHVFTDPTKPIRQQGVTEQGIRIGNGCWLGARVTILDGTHMGDNCVVAAGAVVKGEFPAHSLIGGIPARVLRSLAD